MRVRGSHLFDKIPRFDNVSEDNLIPVHSAAADPTTTDDTNSGYFVGYGWINTTSDEAFICVDSTASAAVWESINLKEFPDNLFRITDNGDDTKKIAFEASGLTTATTRTLTMPDKNVTLGTDDDAIHDNVAGEINAITEKTTPVGADLLLIEDSADSNNKKKVQITNLPSGGGGTVNSAFSAHRITSNQTLNNIVETIFVANNEDRDEGGDYSTSTGKFTAPVTGWYTFNATLTIQTFAFGNMFVRIYQNTTKVAEDFTDAPSAGVFNLGCSATLYLTSGDTVDVRAYQNSGSTASINAGTQCRFSGHQVGGI
jgi:hypothetical protein